MLYQESVGDKFAPTAVTQIARKLWNSAIQQKQHYDCREASMGQKPAILDPDLSLLDT